MLSASDVQLSKGHAPTVDPSRTMTDVYGRVIGTWQGRMDQTRSIGGSSVIRTK